MPDLDPKLVAALGAVVVDVVTWLLHRGQPSGVAAGDDVKRIAAEAAQAAIESAWEALRVEGFVLATDALAEAANGLLDEMRRLDALMPAPLPPVDPDPAGSRP